MNRHIKFKGKRISNDKWVYGDLIIHPNHTGKKHYIHEHYSDTEYLVDEKTIGQFIIMYDKHNTPIFEGDKVRCVYNGNVFEYVVAWDDDELDRMFLYAEIIADIILFTDVLIRNDLSFYFLLNIIIFSVITKNLCCGGTKMRAKVNPTEKEREQYDNNSSIINSIATLIGAGTAIIFDFDLKVLFILAFIGNAIDNVFYLYIYKKIKE